MSKAISVRQAHAADAETLHQLICALARYESREAENESSVEAIRKELADEHGILKAFMAEIDGEAVGMVTYILSFGTFVNKRGIYVEDIYVKEDFRHSGIGTALMRSLAAHAIEKDYGRMEWMTLVWNNDAMDFFSSLGSKPNDAWTAFREDRPWINKIHNND